MARCDRCGNDYDKSFTVSRGGTVAHLRQLRVRDLDAGSRMCALQVQDHRPRGGGERQILLLRPLRDEVGCRRIARPRGRARRLNHRSGRESSGAGVRGRFGRTSAKRRSVGGRVQRAAHRSILVALQRGEEDLHMGAGADLAVDPDVPARLLHEAISHRQPESRPLSRILRREEGVEHAVDMLVRDAAAGVGDYQRDIGARRATSAPNPAATSSFPVRMQSRPPCGIASRALTTRLSRTLSS